MTAPIALFVYNRPSHTRQTVEALQRNHLASESDLFVYSDAPATEAATASVAQVRAYIRSVDGFKSITVVERASNWGVDASVIDGVTELCTQHGRAIVLEDDLVTSPFFLSYMNRGLDAYQDSDVVMQVSGFMFPVQGLHQPQASLLPYSNSWGWGTWRRAWSRFDPDVSGYPQLKNDKRLRRSFNLNGAYDYFGLLQSYVDGKTTAWDIRWYLSIFMQGGLSLFPHKSFVNNIGFDGSGVHCLPSDLIVTDLATSDDDFFPAIERSVTVVRAVEKYLYRRQPRSLKKSLKQAFGLGS